MIRCPKLLKVQIRHSRFDCPMGGGCINIARSGSACSGKGPASWLPLPERQFDVLHHPSSLRL
jgi:hypothetical protein